LHIQCIQTDRSALHPPTATAQKQLRGPRPRPQGLCERLLEGRQLV